MQNRLVRLTLLGSIAFCIAWHFIFLTKIFDDQVFALFEFGKLPYPQVDLGLANHLLAGVYKFIFSPAPEYINSHIKSLAAILFFASSYWLSLEFKLKDSERALFIIALLTSRIPFLWNSAEIFATAYMNCALVLVFRNQWGWRLGILLGLLPLCRPEMGLVCAGFGIVGLYRVGFKKVFWTAAISVILVATLAVPSFLEHGKDAIYSRGFAALMAHYGYVFSAHQFCYGAPCPEKVDAFADWRGWIRPSFEPAHTIFEVIWMYPRRYLDYVAISIFSRGTTQSVRLFGIFLPLVWTRIWLALTSRYKWTSIERVAWPVLLSLVSLLFISTPKLRCLTRFYPIAVLGVIYLGSVIKNDRFGKAFRWTLKAAFALQFIVFAYSLWHGRHDAQFWFPD